MRHGLKEKDLVLKSGVTDSKGEAAGVRSMRQVSEQY
jgi:hypothetical protein